MSSSPSPNLTPLKKTNTIKIHSSPSPSSTSTPSSASSNTTTNTNTSTSTSTSKNANADAMNANNIIPRSINLSSASTHLDSIDSHSSNLQPPATNLSRSPDSSTCSTMSSSSSSSSNPITSSPIPKFTKSSKRSSSSSNDFIYERDRFRARLHTFNQAAQDSPDHDKDNENDKDSKPCEICDDIGSKTTKLNIISDESEVESSHFHPSPPSNAALPTDSNDIVGSESETKSPLDSTSKFYSSLSDFPQSLDNIPIKLIDSNHLTQIFRWYFNKESPPTSEMFPWLHGLHEDNLAQKLFFIYQHQQQIQQRIDHQQYDSHQNTSLQNYSDSLISYKPPGHIRFLMCINPFVSPSASSSSSSSSAILKNSINIDEILKPIDVSRLEVIKLLNDIINSVYPESQNDDLINLIINDCFKLRFLPQFLNLDPDKGVSLRNFHIQVAKVALCSDFIVYSDKENLSLCGSLSRLLYIAQRFYNHQSCNNVFILDDLSSVHSNCTIKKPDNSMFQSLDSNKKTQLNSLNINYNSNTLFIWDNDYQFKEKIETTKMSSATSILKNVWAGNIWDYQIMLYYLSESKSISKSTTGNKLPEKNLYCNPLNSIISNHEFTDDAFTSNTNTAKSSSNILSFLPSPKSTWKLFIHCHKDASFPSLASLSRLLIKFVNKSYNLNDYDYLEFPPSGSLGLGDCKKENLMAIANTCKLLYLNDNNSSLIYCSDGYTELSLLVLCYTMYSKNYSLEKAMLYLHLEVGRPFYIFSSDVTILMKLETLLNKLSPCHFKNYFEWKSSLDNLTNPEINELLLSPRNLVTKPIPKTLKLGYIANDSDSDSSDYLSSDDEDLSSNLLGSHNLTASYLHTDWVKEVEGSIPSRILPYLYLGSLKHANSLSLLSKLGIKKIISVGENLHWINGSKFQQNNDIVIDEFHNGDIELYNIIPNNNHGQSPIETILKINNLQDDGIDELTHTLPLILKYIDDEYEKSGGQTKILVHCRVGVSRSATVCIAEVMKRFKLSLPKAYLYVRVRRLNIVIQPNLRFMYELFKWDEQEKLKKLKQNHHGVNVDDDIIREHNSNTKLLREIDWFVMCREITNLNIPYLNN